MSEWALLTRWLLFGGPICGPGFYIMDWLYRRLMSKWDAPMCDRHEWVPDPGTSGDDWICRRCGRRESK